MAPSRPLPPLPAKESRAKNAQNPQWHLTHFYVKFRLIDYSSMMLKCERPSRRLRSGESSFTLLCGTQFFFKWGQANPFTLLCFQGQGCFTTSGLMMPMSAGRSSLTHSAVVVRTLIYQKCFLCGRVPVGSAHCPQGLHVLQIAPLSIRPSILCCMTFRIKASS